MITTRYETFFIVDPWGEGTRWLKAIDDREGLDPDERVIGTYDAGEAVRFDSQRQAYIAAWAIAEFPRAKVARVSALYSVEAL